MRIGGKLALRACCLRSHMWASGQHQRPLLPAALQSDLRAVLCCVVFEQILESIAIKVNLEDKESLIRAANT
jgi:hypothetical protein